MVNEYRHRRWVPSDEITLIEKVALLKEMQCRGEVLHVGGLLGLPELSGDIWVDAAGAAIICNVQPHTIRSYITRDQPIRMPFPKPAIFLGNQYWPASVLLAWHDKYRATQYERH